ncbi:hypothetical protein EDB19DRAFT_967082 [Suillus lakei]|nr:hypothetical protein EDB19DRAFT_967082 [Suillus lakei]
MESGYHSTACWDNNAYVWDIQAIKAADIEDLPSMPHDIEDKSFLEVPTSSGTHMNSHKGFLVICRPMYIPPQHLVPVPSFSHSLVVFPHSFAALDPMKRSKLNILQCLRSHVHMRSSITCPRSFAALDLMKHSKHSNCQCLQSHVHMHSSIACPHSFALRGTLMKHPNIRNPQRFRDYVHRCSSVTFPHSCPALDSIPTKQPILSNPKRPRGHVQVHSSVACPRSSALHPTAMKGSNFSNGRGKLPPLIVVLMSSKLLQYGTGRCVFLECVNPCGPIISMQTLYVSPPQETASDKAKRIKNPEWWVRMVLFLCCVSPGTDDSPGTNATPRST